MSLRFPKNLNKENPSGGHREKIHCNRYELNLNLVTKFLYKKFAITDQQVSLLSYRNIHHLWFYGKTVNINSTVIATCQRYGTISYPLQYTKQYMRSSYALQVSIQKNTIIYYTFEYIRAQHVWSLNGWR